MELGFLRGDGDLGSDGVLTLGLVDPQAVPAEGDAVVTWGSAGARRTSPGCRWAR